MSSSNYILNRLPLLVFIPTYFSIRANFHCLSPRCPINFLDPSLVYIKFLFPIYKQFSILIIFLIGKVIIGFPHLNQITAKHTLLYCCSNSTLVTFLQAYHSSLVKLNPPSFSNMTNTLFHNSQPGPCAAREFN